MKTITRTNKKPKQTPAELADSMGRLKARMADLKREYEAAREALAKRGEGIVEGRLFRCTISEVEVEKVDYKGLIERLKPSKRLVESFTTTDFQTRVCVTSRTGKDAE